MNGLLRMGTLVILTGLAVGGAQAADCGATAPRDACLVGTWKMTENGAERWMRENIHQAHVAGVASANNIITLKADGNYFTEMSNTTAHVVANNEDVQGTGNLKGKSTGRWSTEGGKFTLCPISTTTSGQIEVHSQTEAWQARVPAPHVPNHPAQIAYHCAGNRFTTTQPMPHHTTMTSTYTKIR